MELLMCVICYKLTLSIFLKPKVLERMLILNWKRYKIYSNNCSLNMIREIRQAVGLSWTEPRSPPFGFDPYFNIRPCGNLRRGFLYGCRREAMIRTQRNFTVLWCPLREDLSVFTLHLNVTSTRTLSDFVLLFFIGWASLFLLRSAFAVCDYTGSVPSLGKRSDVHCRICLLITLGLWFCRDVSKRHLLVNTLGTRYDISLCKVKSCRSIAKQALDFLQNFL